MASKLERDIPNNLYMRIKVAVGDKISIVEEAYQKNPERTMEYINSIPVTADSDYLYGYMMKNIIEPHQVSYPKNPTLGDLFKDILNSSRK